MRSKLLLTLLIGLTVTFVFRLFQIQIIDSKYTLDAANNAQRMQKIFAPRGIIFDRDSNLLAMNQAAYDIEVTTSLLNSLDTSRLSKLIGVNEKKIKSSLIKAQRYSPYRPSSLIRGLTAQDFAKIQEEISFYPGISMRRRTFRKYSNSASGSAIGYMGEVNDYILSKKPEYKLGDYIGIAGIEASYEKYLRGKDGIQYITVDNLNRDKGPFQEGKYDIDPVPGKNIMTTLDSRLQEYGKLLMSGKRGSIVAISPESGEILTLLSSPDYNPNLLVGRHRSKNYNLLYLDSINKPLFHRGLLAVYPPGSPFKIINALIALEEETIKPSTNFNCIDGYHYGELHIGCHCESGLVNLRKSISHSCNNYHCQVFKKTLDKFQSTAKGLDEWEKHVRSFGLGNYLGVDINSGRKGFVPNSDFYNNYYQNKRWKAPTIVSLAIGQGELGVTPLQLSNMTAIIANRGHWFIPHIVKSIEGTMIDSLKYLTPMRTTIKKKHFDTVIKGMEDVFKIGTAKESRLNGIRIAGKTGTAENPHGQDHSIFIAFAPIDSPKIAIAVIIENGYWGSRWAAPIASLMIEKYINDTIARTDLEERMISGSLANEYGVESVEIKLPHN